MVQSSLTDLNVELSSSRWQVLSVDFIEMRISARFRSTSISSGTVMDSFNVKFVAWLVMNQQVVDVRIWRRVPWTELGTGVRYTTPSNARFRDGLTRLQWWLISVEIKWSRTSLHLAKVNNQKHEDRQMKLGLTRDRTSVSVFGPAVVTTVALRFNDTQIYWWDDLSAYLKAFKSRNLNAGNG